MQNPAIDILIRLGWALLCGFCIFMVPLLFRRALHADTRVARIVSAILTVLFFAAFCGVAWYLWQNHVPQAETPPPAELPAALPPLQ